MKRHLAATIGLLGALAVSGGAYADSLEFEAELSGDEEVPPVVTDAEGDAKFEVNSDLTEIEFEFEVKDGVGILGAAGAHIHCAPLGEEGPVVVFLAGDAPPAGFQDKVEMKGTFTAEQITNDACGGTIEALVEAMRLGDTYVNVHSIANPGGEVRGQIELDD